MAVRRGGEIGMYTAHPNLRKWEILGRSPRTNCMGEDSWYAVGRSWIKSAACKTA